MHAYPCIHKKMNEIKFSENTKKCKKKLQFKTNQQQSSSSKIQCNQTNTSQKSPKPNNFFFVVDATAFSVIPQLSFPSSFSVDNKKQLKQHTSTTPLHLYLSCAVLLFLVLSELTPSLSTNHLSSSLSTSA